MEVIISAIITGTFALFAAIFSKRASKEAQLAKEKAALTHIETQPNGGKSLADKIDQFGRRLITMDERSERTERKLDQLAKDHSELSDSVRKLEENSSSKHDPL